MNVNGCIKIKHDNRIDKNCLVVMIVANSNAPNSRIVYKMHNCPNIAATLKVQISCNTAGCLPTNATASKNAESENNHKALIDAEHKFTHSI